MSPWMLYALIALVLFGLAGVTQKLSTNHASAQMSMVGFALGFLAITVVILLTQPREALQINHYQWAALSGMIMGFGTLASFAAYHSGGKASIVTPLQALYPVVTVSLAVPLLHEHISPRVLLGIVVAIVAAIALSYEGNANKE